MARLLSVHRFPAFRTFSLRVLPTGTLIRAAPLCQLMNPVLVVHRIQKDSKSPNSPSLRRMTGTRGYRIPVIRRGPSAIIGWANEGSARGSLDEGGDKLYRELHLLCRHRSGQWHWHLPMCIFFIWIRVPIEILLCILIPSTPRWPAQHA